MTLNHLKMKKGENPIWDEWWQMFLSNPVMKQELIRILNFLEDLDQNKIEWYPVKQVFRAFYYSTFKGIKVCCIGMDPYHNPGSACGIAFKDLLAGTKGRKNTSLTNIEKELGGEVDFEGTAKQGVLWLNSSLTVTKGEPGSHRTIWKKFTKELIRMLNEKDDLIWVLWGSHALSFKKLIDNPTHKFIISSHPSPLSCNKPLGEYPPFKGSDPFGQVNNFLTNKIDFMKVKITTGKPKGELTKKQKKIAKKLDEKLQPNEHTYKKK